MQGPQEDWWGEVTEHAAWCERIGMTPRDVLLALKTLIPNQPTWKHALDALYDERKHIAYLMLKNQRAGRRVA